MDSVHSGREPGRGRGGASEWRRGRGQEHQLQDLPQWFEAQEDKHVDINTGSHRLYILYPQTNNNAIVLVRKYHKRNKFTNDMGLAVSVVVPQLYFINIDLL